MNKHERRMERGAMILAAPVVLPVVATMGAFWLLGWLLESVASGAEWLLDRLTGEPATPDSVIPEPTYRDAACPHCGGALHGKGSSDGTR